MILQAENLTVRLSIAGRLTPVVRAATLGVARGETLGVVGESGCGKSVMNLAVMGLLPPGSVVSADRFELCGQDLRGLSAREWRNIRGRIAAMVFQNPMSALNPSLTVGMQLLEAVRRAEPSAGRAQAERRAMELLGQVGLGSGPSLLRAYAHELSGGMAQRVMIAMAVACRPSLLIADEPTTALDATIQAQILELLVRVRDENDMAVILVSHDIGVVEEYADRIMVMYSGEVVEVGPTSVVTEDGRHPYTRGLLNSLPARQDVPPKTPLGAIAGVVPPVGQMMPGCRFEPRCPLARERCLTHPELVPREGHPGAAFRCFF